MKPDFDLAIIGSGFGGSVLSMIARRIGLSVALIERGSHPRFAIGESTSPLANLSIEQLADRYDLPRIRPLATYGEWQRVYPEIVCGLKRGFTYFKHEAHQRYRVAPDRSNQLLVAASPRDEVADTHWLRSDVDHFLVKEAAALGVEYLDQTSLHSIEFPVNGIVRLQGERFGEPVDLKARLVIDASGPRGCLHRLLNLPEEDFDRDPPTQTLYSHFTNVRRCDEMKGYAVNEVPPYPLDDAAVHHVFDGGWMWVLRFNNGVTSAGIAVTGRLARELRVSEGAPAWNRFLSRFPSIAEQFAEAKPTRAFVYTPRSSFRSKVAAGNNWAMLPSSAAFIDPLFSTGVPLTLLGIERLGEILAESFNQKDLPERLRSYAEMTLFEADRTAEFIAACYAGFPRFENFVSYSMFYFAAASFSETARRLGREGLVERFLAVDHPHFARAISQCGLKLREKSTVDPRDFETLIKWAIDPLNIAGLCDPKKTNWYGINLDDVVRGSAKLGFTTDELWQLLHKIS